MSFDLDASGRRKSLVEAVAEKGLVDLTISKDDVQVADVLDVQATPEEEARVLRKIDRWYVTLQFECRPLVTCLSDNWSQDSTFHGLLLHVAIHG